MAHGAEIAVVVAPTGTAVPAGTQLCADRSLEWVTDTLVSGGSP